MLRKSRAAKALQKYLFTIQQIYYNIKTGFVKKESDSVMKEIEIWGTFLWKECKIGLEKEY